MSMVRQQKPRTTILPSDYQLLGEDTIVAPPVVPTHVQEAFNTIADFLAKNEHGYFDLVDTYGEWTKENGELTRPKGFIIRGWQPSHNKCPIIASPFVSDMVTQNKKHDSLVLSDDKRIL